MSDFKAKINQIRFGLGLRWGSLQPSPRPSSWIQGALLLREGRGGEGKGEGLERSPLCEVLNTPLTEDLNIVG